MPRRGERGVVLGLQRLATRDFVSPGFVRGGQVKHCIIWVIQDTFSL
jgi:hypothetical protein